MITIRCDDNDKKERKSVRIDSNLVYAYVEVNCQFFATSEEEEKKLKKKMRREMEN